MASVVVSWLYSILVTICMLEKTPPQNEATKWLWAKICCACVLIFGDDLLAVDPLNPYPDKAEIMKKRTAMLDFI